MTSTEHIAKTAPTPQTGFFAALRGLLRATGSGPPSLRGRGALRLATTVTLVALCLLFTPTAQAEVTGKIPGSDRVYELVSPPDMGGWPVYIQHSLEFIVLEANSLGGGVEPGGNLSGHVSSPLDVSADGSAVLWASQATPPGTGAISKGLGVSPFRSVRTPTGWVTRDMLPTSYGSVGQGREVFPVAISADGSAALVATRDELTPEDFTSSDNNGGVEFLYRVRDDGSPPQLVTHGEALIPSNISVTTYHALRAVSASPDLRQVAFFSKVQLGPGDACVDASVSPLSFVEFWDAGVGVARPVVSLGSCVAPNVGHAVPTVLPDGRPVIYPNPVNPLGPAGFAVGPLVVNNRDLSQPNALVPLTGPSGAIFLAASPDGHTAYVSSTDPLDAQHPTAASQIYAISTAVGSGWLGSGPVPVSTPGVSCVSCARGAGGVSVAGPGNADGFRGLSPDGSHFFFASADGALWSYDTRGSQSPQEVAPASVTPNLTVVSRNGLHLVAQTSAGPAEYTLGDTAPTSLAACGSPVAISDDGSRVVCNNTSGALKVIDEWVDGVVHQISPLGSVNGYETQSQWVTGGELRDVFFTAEETLLPTDTNGSAARIYDARLDGGFPIPSSCSGEACQGTPASIPALGSIGSATFSGPGNPLLTTPAAAGKPPVRPLTRAQKLTRALGACRVKHDKHRRAACEREARKKYGPPHKANTTKRSR